MAACEDADGVIGIPNWLNFRLAAVEQTGNLTYCKQTSRDIKKLLVSSLRIV